MSLREESSLAIKVETLSKAYRIGESRTKQDTLTASFLRFLSYPFRQFRAIGKLNTYSSAESQSNTIWALKGVSFEVKKGDVIGIIGHNGAGKSTLLKILSRITDPTEGCVQINGRVASLLEVGTGFHPELTGRENVFLNGTILGMRKSEVSRKLDEIIEFSGCAQLIDTPLKRYSSGMKVRLAFSVAAHLSPEILIIDEVLAVGDLEFQRKCIEKMNSVASNGRTVLFVSHNLSLVKSLCHRSIILERGRASSLLETEAAITQFMRSLQANKMEDVHDSEFIKKVRVKVSDAPKRDIYTGDCVDIELELMIPKDAKSFSIVGGVMNHYNTKIFTIGMSLDPKLGEHSIGGDRTAVCQIENFNVSSGRYRIALVLSVDNQDVERLENAHFFDVHESNFHRCRVSEPPGVVQCRQSWKIV